MGGLEDAFVNFVSDVAPAVWGLLWVVGAAAAFIWVASVFTRAWRGTAVPGAASVSIGEILAVLILSALLANYAGTLNTFSHSIGLGDANFGPISYISESSALGRFSAVINSAMTFAAMMGGIYGMKGLFLIYRQYSGEGNQGKDLAYKGLVHFISGGLLVQIAAVISNAANSAGM